MKIRLNLNDESGNITIAELCQKLLENPNAMIKPTKNKLIIISETEDGTTRFSYEMK